MVHGNKISDPYMLFLLRTGIVQKEEVNALMKLLRNYMKTCLKTAAKNDMKVRVIGDITKLDEDIQKRILELEEATKNNGGLNFRLQSIMEVVMKSQERYARLAEDVKEGKLMPEEVNEACIERYLDTHDIPDPDLLISHKWRAEIVQLSFVAACLYRVLFY